MNTASVIFQAILHVAKKYNSQNILEWGERHTYGQQCDQIADELKAMGYCIRKGSNPIINELNAVLTNEEGE